MNAKLKQTKKYIKIVDQTASLEEKAEQIEKIVDKTNKTSSFIYSTLNIKIRDNLVIDSLNFSIISLSGEQSKQYPNFFD